MAVPTPSSSTHRKRKEHFAENRWHSRKIYAPACSVHSLTHGMKQIVLTLFLPREVWLYLPPSAWVFSRGDLCALTMTCLNCNYFLLGHQRCGCKFILCHILLKMKISSIGQGPRFEKTSISTYLRV